MRAEHPESIKTIICALNLTKQWLGVSDKVDWTGRLYQRANRLAHLYFFREIVHVPAWLVNVYFFDDITWKPTSQKEWNSTISKMKAEMGLTGINVPYVAGIFLPGVDTDAIIEQQAP